MSKPLHPDAPLIARAIKAVDKGGVYDWNAVSYCLAGWYTRAIGNDPYSHNSVANNTYSKLSNLAFKLHHGVPPDIEASVRFSALKPIIPYDDWPTLRSELCKFYNLAEIL